MPWIAKPLPTLMVAATLLAPAGVATNAFAQDTDPAASVQQSDIDQLLKFYADLYGKPENFETRLGGLVSVISLSRYDGAPLTQRLLEAAGSGDPIIAQAAWDALAARHGSLTPEQVREWQDLGLRLASGRNKNDVFLGSELRPLLLALAARPVEKDAPRFIELITRAIAQNDLATEKGRATLEAAGQALAAWGDANLIGRFTRNARGDNAQAQRTAFVLSQVPGAPAADASVADWRAWTQQLKLAPTTRPFDAGGVWFEPPTVIDDASDARFRREVELPPLNISGVDLVLAIDATGSLSDSNDYLKHYLAVTLQALSVLSNNVRVGVVYYRHEIRPELQQDCCRTASQDGRENAFLYDIVPLTGNYNALLAAMNKERLQGVRTGHAGTADGSGSAPATGFEMAVRLLAEQSRQDAARVVVVQTDDDPTDGSKPVLAAMLTEAREFGVLPVLLIRDDSDARRMQDVIDASGDPAINYRDDLDTYKTDAVDPYVDFQSKPLGQMTARVITSTLPPDYADRGPEVMKIVGKHMAAASAAQRAANP